MVLNCLSEILKIYNRKNDIIPKKGTELLKHLQSEILDWGNILCKGG